MGGPWREIITRGAHWWVPPPISSFSFSFFFLPFSLFFFSLLILSFSLSFLFFCCCFLGLGLEKGAERRADGWGGGRPGDGAHGRRNGAGARVASAAGGVRGRDGGLARARPGRRGGWERRRRLEAAERRRRLGVAASAAGSGGAGSGRQSGIGGRGGGATAARLVPGWQLAEEDATRRVARWLRPGGGGARAGPPVGGQGPRRSATPVGRDGRRPAEGRRGRGGLLVRLGRTMAERLEAAQTRLGRGSFGRSGCKRYGGVGRVEAGTVRGCRHLAWRLRKTTTRQWLL